MPHSTTPATTGDGPKDYDVIIIGAGLSGLYQLYRCRELGLKTKVIELAPEVGGTWSVSPYFYRDSTHANVD